MLQNTDWIQNVQFSRQHYYNGWGRIYAIHAETRDGRSIVQYGDSPKECYRYACQYARQRRDLPARKVITGWIVPIAHEW